MSMRFVEETFTHGSHPDHRFRPIEHLPRMMQCSICSALESQGAWYECCQEQCHYILCPKCFEVDEKLFPTPQIVIRRTDIPFDDATICVHTRPRPSSYKLSPINPCKLMEVVSHAECREDSSLTYFRLYKGGWINSRHVAAIIPENESIYNLAMIHIHQVHAMRMYDVAVNARMANANTQMHKLLFSSSCSSSSSLSSSPCHENMKDNISADSLIRYMQECMKTIDKNTWDGFVMSVFTLYPLVLAIDMHKDEIASVNNCRMNNNVDINDKKCSNRSNGNESRTKYRNSDVSVAEEDVIICSSNNNNNTNSNRREQLLRYKSYSYNDNAESSKNNNSNEKITFAFDEDCANEEQMEVCNSSKSQSYSRNQVPCLNNTTTTTTTSQSSMLRQQEPQEQQQLLHSPYQRAVKDVIVKFVYFITEAVLFDMNEALNQNNYSNNCNINGSSTSIMSGVRLSLYTDVLSGVLLVAHDLTNKWQVQLPAAFVHVYTRVLTLCAQMHVLMQHINLTTEPPRLREPAVVTRHIDIPTERIRLRQMFRCVTDWSHSQLLSLTQHYNSSMCTLQPLREQLIVMPHSEVFERIFCELLLQMMQHSTRHDNSLFWSVDPIEIIVRLIRCATSWESQLVACKLITQSASWGASQFRSLSIVALLPLMHMTKTITNVNAILAALECIEAFTHKPQPQAQIQPQQSLRKHWSGWSKRVLQNYHSDNTFDGSEHHNDEDGINYNSNNNINDDNSNNVRKCRSAGTPEILGEMNNCTSPEVSPVRVRCNQCTSHNVQLQEIQFFILANGLTIGLCEYCAQMHPPSEATVTSLNEIYYNSFVNNNNNRDGSRRNNNGNNVDSSNNNDPNGYDGNNCVLNNSYNDYFKYCQKEYLNSSNNNNNCKVIGPHSHSPVYFVCQCTICVKANNGNYYTTGIANETSTQEYARSKSPYMQSNDDNIINNNNNNANWFSGKDNSDEMKFVNDAICTIFDGDRLSQFLRKILQDHYSRPHIVNAVGKLLLHIPTMQMEVWKLLFEILANVQRLDCYSVALLAIASRRYLPVMDELCKQLNQSATLAHYLQEPYILLTPTKRLCTEEMVCGGGSSSNQLSSVGLSPSPLTMSTYRSSVVSEVQFSGIGYSNNHPVVNLFASSDGMLMRDSE